MKPTLLYRHRRENLKKCSLSGLERHPLLRFYTYPVDPLPDLSGYLLLKVGAPPLSTQDRDFGLLLIDATWRLSHIMLSQCPKIEARSLPNTFRTAYPRRQTACEHPEEGLATVEALFAAHLLLGKSVDGLLDHYYWKQPFLELNGLACL